MAPARTHRRRARHLESMGAMAAGLAHEIKNPLSTMSLNLQLLAEDFSAPQTPRDERALRRAKLLLGEVERLDGIVRDFLTLARGYEIEPETVDLELLLTQLVSFTAPEHERLGIEVRTSFAPSARFVVADPKHLHVALMNLIVNAQQAMEGRDDAQLFVETRDRGEFAEVRITDTGPGIPVDKVDKIFMPFWSSKTEGTGLGLPTTRRIIEECGGEIGVQSAPGHGTRFTVILPKVPKALPGGPVTGEEAR